MSQEEVRSVAGPMIQAWHMYRQKTVSIDRWR